MSQAGRLSAGSGPVTPSVLTLTGNTGGAVGPDGGGNIDVVGSGSISVAGNPGTNTLTISNSGAVATSFPTDVGTAIPALGALTIAGGNNIGTVGVGSTVTIHLDGTTNHALQVGSATGALTSLAVATNGQLPIGSTGADPVIATLTAGTGINITNGAGSITIASTVVGGIQTIFGDQGTGISGTTVTIHTDQASSNANGTPFFVNNTNVSELRFSDGLGNTIIGRFGAGLGIGGSSNVGLGDDALSGAGFSGNENTGIGNNSLSNIDNGNANTALGYSAGLFLTNGSNNVFLGHGTGGTIGPITGSYNVGIGKDSGDPYTSSESSNISINAVSTPVTGESNVLRIGNGTGTGNQQLANAYISGINGVNVGSVASVVAISGDHLGSTTITAGSGITVTPGANTITIAASGSSFTWTEVTGTSQAMAVNNGYILNNAGLVTATLPATAAVGDIVRVAGKGAGGWLIAQNSGQTIFFGSSTTTPGVGGSLASTNRRDCIELICVTANNDWDVLSSIGNITVV